MNKKITSLVLVLVISMLMSVATFASTIMVDAAPPIRIEGHQTRPGTSNQMITSVEGDIEISLNGFTFFEKQDVPAGQTYFQLPYGQKYFDSDGSEYNELKVTLKTDTEIYRHSTHITVAPITYNLEKSYVISDLISYLTSCEISLSMENAWVLLKGEKGYIIYNSDGMFTFPNDGVMHSVSYSSTPCVDRLDTPDYRIDTEYNEAVIKAVAEFYGYKVSIADNTATIY